MRAGRVVLIIVGSLVGLIGLALLAGGGFLLWAHETQRDDQGFYTSGVLALRSDAYALTAEGIEIADVPDELFRKGRLAQVRIRGTGQNGKDIFLGIAREEDVDSYLDGVAHDEVKDVGFSDSQAPEDIEYRRIEGTTQPPAPDGETFWVASASGSGEQTVLWDVTGGDWAIVAMNADASADIAIDATVAAKAGFIIWVAIGLLAGGLVLLAVGGLLVFLGARSDRRPPDDTDAPAVATAGAPLAGSTVLGESTEPDAAAPYPVELEGTLDPSLSRALWLVKWLLAIPHYIVLAFLGIAFFFLTFIAFFAILITGRYPRGIFDFNVGVLRWAWRVAFYSYSALGTDRYPPFSLGPEPDYPATLEIPYPERLSRGLVLVKWWLLAIPHYLVIGVFNGSWGFTRWGWGDWGGGNYDWGWIFWGGGLIGLLVLLAALALLFTARYPRDLFGFIVGMNRWTFRVWAYAFLMRDEYPPFRLGR